MAGLYNLTTLTEVNSTSGIVEGINNLTNNWFGIMMSLSLFVVILIYISFYNFPAAFTAASTLSALLSAFLFYAGLIPLMGVIIPVCLAFIGVLIMVMFQSG